MRRYTIKEIQELTDREFLELVVIDRRSTLTNPYTPLYLRLTNLIGKLEGHSNLESVVADLLDSVFDQAFVDDSGNLDEERAIRYLKYGLAPVRDSDFTKGLCQLCGKGAHFGHKQEDGKGVWICLVCGVEYSGYLCEGCGSPMNKGEEIRSDGDPLYCKACYDDMTEQEKEEGFSNYRALVNKVG